MRDMVMANDVDRPATANRLTRVFVCLLGAGAIAWGGFALPLFWQEASPRSTATKILQGNSFKLQSLVAQAHQAETATHYRFCNPVALHSVFVLQLSILNQAIEAANQPLGESPYHPVSDAAQRALACAPTDSFVWLTLFWLDAGQHGLNRDNTNYLRLSYDFGRNEGWIALWRFRLALLFFERLPPDLASDALDDFINLMETGQYYWPTAGIFIDASPGIQSRIVERLKTADLATRQAFARTLHDRGMDVAIPGVEQPEARPWR
jgi:hypothetical protein